MSNGCHQDVGKAQRHYFGFDALILTANSAKGEPLRHQIQSLLNIKSLKEGFETPHSGSPLLSLSRNGFGVNRRRKHNLSDRSKNIENELSISNQL